jgi:hypothetical protein
MRWTVRNPQYGDTRVREWFALWPVVVGYPNTEWRWLERVRVREEFMCGRVADFWVRRAFV